MRRGSKVEDFLRPLGELPTQVCLNNMLQVADIIEWVIAQIGECEVWQSSFSVSEELMRRLFFIRERGELTKISLLLDHKATNMTVKLWVFIEAVADETHLADNHSKFVLFRAKSGRVVSVITSQNLTRGNRNEVYVVSTEEHIFNELLSSMQDIVKNYSVPLSEIMQQAESFEF